MTGSHLSYVGHGSRGSRAHVTHYLACESATPGVRASPTARRILAPNHDRFGPFALGRGYEMEVVLPSLPFVSTLCPLARRIFLFYFIARKYYIELKIKT
jgi:hypothetical protein